MDVTRRTVLLEGITAGRPPELEGTRRIREGLLRLPGDLLRFRSTDVDVA